MRHAILLLILSAVFLLAARSGYLPDGSGHYLPPKTSSTSGGSGDTVPGPAEDVFCELPFELPCELH